MFRTVLKIDGMMCGMCESHINDAVRRRFDVSRVSSSHTRGETIIISNDRLDEAQLRETIGETGYELKDVTVEPYEKHSNGLFGLFSKKK